jgi:hypothetical protein
MNCTYREPDTAEIVDVACLIGLDNGDFRAAPRLPDHGEFHRIYIVDWSLDGKYIAFDVSKFGVYILDADSLEVVAVITGGEANSPFWIE